MNKMNETLRQTAEQNTLLPFFALGTVIAIASRQQDTCNKRVAISEKINIMLFGIHLTLIIT